MRQCLRLDRARAAALPCALRRRQWTRSSTSASRKAIRQFPTCSAAQVRTARGSRFDVPDPRPATSLIARQAGPPSANGPVRLRPPLRGREHGVDSPGDFEIAQSCGLGGCDGGPYRPRAWCSGVTKVTSAGNAWRCATIEICVGLGGRSLPALVPSIRSLPRSGHHRPGEEKVNVRRKGMTIYGQS